jgi:hypothetical protein
LLADTPEPFRRGREGLSSAAARRPRGAQGLGSVHWITTGTAKIERHIRPYPLSSDHDAYQRMKDDLVPYRLTFGQPRREDLMRLLAERFGLRAALRWSDWPSTFLPPTLEPLLARIIGMHSGVVASKTTLWCAASRRGPAHDPRALAPENNGMRAEEDLHSDGGFRAFEVTPVRTAVAQLPLLESGSCE